MSSLGHPGVHKILYVCMCDYGEVHVIQDACGNCLSKIG